MKQHIIILLLLMIVSCGNPKTNKHQHASHSKKSASSKIAMLMHQPMMDQDIQKTQNPDLDFLANMIPHHQGAILSAEELLKVSKNKTILSIASNIIAAQKAETTEFSNIIASLKTNSSYSSDLITKYQQNSEHIMQQMMVEMGSVKLSENPDKDFLVSMIPHHKGAVAESKNILTLSTNKQIIDIANRIINDQEKEIIEINQILKTL